jgi:hypothetical protein
MCCCHLGQNGRGREAASAARWLQQSGCYGARVSRSGAAAMMGADPEASHEGSAHLWIGALRPRRSVRQPASWK